MRTALKGLQSQAPLKEKLLDILLCLCLVIKANQVTSFWSLGTAGGEADSRAGKGSAVVLQEVCIHAEVSGLAAHVAYQYKAGRGSWAAQLRASLSWERKGRKEESTSEKKQQGSRGVKRLG